MFFHKYPLRTWIRLLLLVSIPSVIISMLTITAGLIFAKAKRHQTVVLPAPTGLYAIGRTFYDWIDSSREEIFAEDEGAKRELFVWIWYPASRIPGSPPAPYLPPAWGKAWNNLHGVMDIILQSHDSIQVHAVTDAPVSAIQAHYPALIFEPGLGLLPTDYTTLIEEMVSYGYIVVGIAPTYSASVVVFPDGRKVEAARAAKLEASGDSTVMEANANRLVTIWAKDVIFVINQLEDLNTDAASIFAGRCDLTHLGVFGHSFGGATAAEVCRLDARCKAGLNIDGTPHGEVVKVGLNKPFMVINSDPRRFDPHWKTFVRAIHSLLNRLPSEERYVLIIKGTGHHNFTDYAIMFSPLRLFGMLGPISGSRGLQITREYVRAFFDTYVKHEPSPLLQGPSPDYPEVQFGHT